MTALGEYIAGRGAAPSRRELNRLIDRYEWFTTARRARALVTGETDPALTLPALFRPTVAPMPTQASAPAQASPFASAADETVPPTCTDRDIPPAADPDMVAPPAVDLIDRFIEHGGYRIDPTGEAPEVEVGIDIDPEMVTSELAEIYRAQGLDDEAEKIYTILKLK
jgi:hypothetical protein